MAIPTILFGANGRLGREIKYQIEHAWAGEFDLHAWDRALCDVTQRSDLHNALEFHKPQLIINCTAFNGMEQCEEHPGQAFATNTQAPADIAEYAREIGALFVHFSTDYTCTLDAVFSRHEKSVGDPCGIYGLSKLLGEKAIQAIDCYHLIFRVASLYGDDFAGSLSPVRELRKDSTAGTKQNPIRVLKQKTTPTSVQFVAAYALGAIESSLLAPRACTGLYNLVPNEPCWKSDFGYQALEIFCKDRAKDAVIIEGTLAVPRPELSVLNNTKFQDTFNVTLPTVSEDLSNFAMILEERARDESAS